MKEFALFPLATPMIDTFYDVLTTWATILEKALLIKTPVEFVSNQT
jgi:hypothetical protein